MTRGKLAELGAAYKNRWVDLEKLHGSSQNMLSNWQVDLNRIAEASIKVISH